MKPYTIVIERIPDSNFSAFALEVPGCIATGDTLEEVQRNISEAIEFPFEGLRQDGIAIPEPTTEAARDEWARGISRMAR